MASDYQPNIPTGTVNLSVDYQNIQNNFSQLNTTYGTDHYAYDDQTSNNGFHMQVTTPSNTPPTPTSALTVLYGYQQSSVLGVLQYSRNWDFITPGPAVPTPLTFMQSPPSPVGLANAGVANVLDFTTIASNVMAKFYCWDPTYGGAISEYQVGWSLTGPTLTINAVAANARVSAVKSGNILQIKNNTGFTSTTYAWSLQFLRIQ